MYATREAWLTDAAGELTPLITTAGGMLPASIRIACGFPSTYRRSGALGETFRPGDSADSTVEILISPTLSDPGAVLAVLLRQLVEAITGNASHKSAVYAALDLRPDKPRDVPGCGINLGSKLQGIAAALGAYPHAALSLADRPKAATRLLKGLCPTCGYTIRLTQKWADKGMPQCPCGDTFNLETTQEA